jgi:hypothetical protein
MRQSTLALTRRTLGQSLRFPKQALSSTSQAPHHVPKKYKTNAEIEAEANYTPTYWRLPTEDPVKLRAGSGVRLWQLDCRENKNLLTARMMSHLRRRLRELSNNPTACTAVIYSTAFNRDHFHDENVVFCSGIDRSAFDNDRTAYVNDVHSIASGIAEFTGKDFVTSYSGSLDGTGFSGERL